MSRRRWSIAAIVVLALAASAAILWWQVPAIARWVVVRQIEALTDRRVTVERFDLALERGRLEVRGLRVADREAGPSLAEIDRLDVRFAPGALLRGRLDVREATIDGVRVRIVRNERGELNIADLLRRPPSREAPPAVTIDRLSLTAGTVLVEDRALATPRAWRAEALTVEASALSTMDAAPRGALRLAAAVAGAPLSVELTELGLVPLRARARVALTGVDAAVAQIAAPADAALVLDRAALTADLTAVLEAGGGLRLDGRGSLDGIAIVRRGGDAPVATVPSLAFAVVGAGVHGQTARIERLEVTGTAVVLDQRSRPPVAIPIDRLGLTVEAIEGDATSVRVRVVAARQGGGEVDVQGTARLTPLSAELRARVTRVDLAVWDALIPLPGRLGGLAESDLTIAVATSPAGVGVRVRGRAALTRLSLSDAGRPLIAAQELELAGIDAEWPRLRIERVRAVRPTVAADRDAEGRLSLMALVPPAGPPSPAAAARAAGPPLTVEIGEFALSEGTLTLDDASVAPPARLRISPFGLTARDVAWPGPGAAKVEMKVALPVTGTFEATGTVSLDPVKLDLRARLAGAALGPYQAYVPVAARIRGRLDADVAITGGLAPRIDLAAKGTAAVRDLAIGERERPLITVARMAMTGLDYRWPATVAVDQFRVERSWAMVERRPDGTLPLASLFRALPADTAPASRDGAAPSPTVLDVAVRESVLEGGALTIVDGAVSPPARVEITGARLEARDFTWPARRPVALQLQMSTPGGGSVRVDGQLGVGSRSLEGKLVASGVDVAPLRPYLPVRGRIAGKAGAELTLNVALEPLVVGAQGKADLQGLSVADGDRPLVTAARIEATGVDYAWPATVKIDRVEIQKPTALLERRADGTLPLGALLAPPGAAPPGTAGQAAAPRPSPLAIDVAVREVVVAGGAAVIVDAAASPPARAELGDLRLTARDIAWPARGAMSIQLQAALGGGSASAEGRLGPDARSLDLKLALRDVDLGLTRGYLAGRATVAGKAGGDFDVKVALEPFAVTASGAASISDLSVSDAGQALVKVPRIEATGLVYAWPAKVSLDRLRAQGAWVQIERGRDGGLTLLSLLAPAPAPPPSGARGVAAPGAGAAGLAPEVSVRETLVENASAAIVDSAVSPATRVEIAGARLVVRDLTWPAKGAARVELLVPTPGSGKVVASGQLALDGTRVDLTLALQGADLAVVQPYVPVRGRVGGTLDGQLAIKGSLAPLAVSATGSVIVTDGLLADGQRLLATVKRLELTGLDADWPRRASLERIVLHQHWVLVERNADGSIPLLAVLAPPAPAASASTTAPAPAPPPSASPKPIIEIGAVVVEDGFVRFVDGTTQPRFVEEVSGLASTARRLGTAPDVRSPFTLGGRLSGNAPFQLEGTVGPILGPLVLDVKGKLSDLALTRLNPFMSQYLGWIARRGVLGLTFDYRIVDDTLDARNDVVVGQPEIVPSRRGEKVRERIGVPVDTLVSLLKDSRGEVKMSVPVTGTVSSRQFDFGDAVWEGIRKTVINVLALPVSWVGKIFYTEDARIDTIQIWPVTFEPGTTQVRRDIAAHAERLATFLKDAPGVTLTLRPIVAADDLAALARAAVRQRIDALAKESGEPVPAAAARLFAARAPGRPAPATADAIIDELAKTEALPDGAASALAKDRVDMLRRELAARGGIAPDRLRVSEGAVPVEASGQGRVEFEILTLPA